jgi:hypothetical protein
MNRATRRSADGGWPVDNGSACFDVAVHQVHAATASRIGRPRLMASALRKTRSIKPRSGQRHFMRPAWRGRPGESPGCLPGLTQWLKSLASSLTQLSGRRQ